MILFPSSVPFSTTPIPRHQHRGKSLNFSFFPDTKLQTLGPKFKVQSGWGPEKWGPGGWGNEGWGSSGWGGHEGWGSEGWGLEGWGPEGWGPEGWGAQNFALFFSVSLPIFAFFFSLWRSSRGFLVVFVKTGAVKCSRLEFSGCRVKPWRFKPQPERPNVHI